MKSYVVVLVILDTLTSFSSAANVLALFPFPLRSHFTAFDHLLVELAARGHRLTVVTPFPKLEPPPNYQQIDVQKCFKIPQERFDVDYLIKEHQDTFHVLRKMSFLVNQFEKILKCAPMQQLYTAKNDYDLVMTELFVSDAMLVYAYKFEKPFILFSTQPLMSWSSSRVGNPHNPSYLAFRFSHYAMEPRSSFYDRVYNTLVYVMALYEHHWKWIPETDRIVRKYFGADTPSVEEIAKNTSMILTLNHFTFTNSHPLVPAVVDVGGLHIKDPQPLPKEIENFLNEAKHGVVYMSLGSLMRSHTMPQHLRKMFLEAFSKLPQKVLWKWEADELTDKPDNVMIKNWMPQRDILAHPNVKLFIAHGGTFGLYEAIWEAVPIIGIPFYGDQKMNLKSIEDTGAGLQLLYRELSADTILEKINSIINNDSYSQNAQKLSRIFKDRPVKPLDEAVYWTEYVIKHKGARQLQSAAVSMTWYQYLLLDVVAFLLVWVLLCSIFVYLSCYYSIRSCRQLRKIKPD